MEAMSIRWILRKIWLHRGGTELEGEEKGFGFVCLGKIKVSMFGL